MSPPEGGGARLTEETMWNRGHRELSVPLAARDPMARNAACCSVKAALSRAEPRMTCAFLTLGSLAHVVLHFIFLYPSQWILVGLFLLWVGLKAPHPRALNPFSLSFYAMSNLELNT